MSAELTKVDSAVAGLSISPKDEKAPDKKTHKRTSSKTEGIWNIKDLGNTLSIYRYPSWLTLLSPQRSKRLNWNSLSKLRG